MRDEDEAAKMDSYRQTPLFQKAQEILGTTRRVVEFINDEAAENLEGYEKEMAQEYANQMYANALMIPAKIAAAHGSSFYDMRMENAAIIRRAARDIMTSCSGFKMFQLNGFDYLDVLRAEIEEFRVLFAVWVSTFDPWDYIIDRWGLFNPPGVNYDDIDPDDDLPFNSNFEDDFED